MIRAVALALVIGCAPSSHELRRPVDAELARRLGTTEPRIGSDDPAVARAIAARLAQPLDKVGAIRIALANSPRLQAALAELGVVGAGRALALGPTAVELQARFGGGGHELELHVIQDLLALVAPAGRSTARHRAAAARAEATATALRLVGRVERAFHDLIAAQQELELRQTAFDAADAATIVRERMFAAGNTPALAQARDRAAREQARIELARAEAAIELRREACNALLGLTGDQTRWTATGRLPELPAAAPALDELEARAVAASLELAAGRARADGAASEVSDQRLRSVLPHLGAGVAVTEHDRVIQVGPAVSLAIPVFDWNARGRARANAELRRAAHELTAVAVELRAGARAARIAALAAYQEARHLRDVVLPLRQQIVDETLKHYNAMDADPFALIVARRELVEAGQQYVDALRRYWNATAEVTALERGVMIERTGEPERSAAPLTPDERSH